MAKRISRITSPPPKYQMYCAFSPLNSIGLFIPLFILYTLVLIVFFLLTFSSFARTTQDSFLLSYERLCVDEDFLFCDIPEVSHQENTFCLQSTQSEVL